VHNCKKKVDHEINATWLKLWANNNVDKKNKRNTHYYETDASTFRNITRYDRAVCMIGLYYIGHGDIGWLEYSTKNEECHDDTAKPMSRQPRQNRNIDINNKSQQVINIFLFETNNNIKETGVERWKHLCKDQKKKRLFNKELIFQSKYPKLTYSLRIAVEMIVNTKISWKTKKKTYDFITNTKKN
jgi:hypothetical protein